MLPPLDDLLATARVLSLPLVTRFRGIETREALVFEGPAGWSEFSPFAEYGDDEAVTWLAAAIEFGWHETPPTRRDSIRVNATVPAVPTDQVAQVLARFAGCRTAKVKVAETGQRLADDVARVREVRRVLGPGGRIRVDANGAWSVDEAEIAIRTLGEFDLEYVEQPCLDLADLAEVRQRVRYLGIPIAADESVRRASDPLEVARTGSADVLVVKVQPLGGIRAVLKLADRTGLPMVVSSALDTSIGLSMGAHLAAALPELDYDCGLGTASLLAQDVTADPLLATGGSIPVRRVTPDPRVLDRFAAPAERRDWWLSRLARCHGLLAASGRLE
ncbi:o-succinylbenzoate synthase [Homoserinimonas sp. OAct 916]|uniref:o-succinylbenzoate synthase n=1 Tax=Homoserinimonas sp. OAct 916 TaxID=2211450 RepID=UPI000DBE4467|nr:o-succinylbenzoate synthase [Homoserinimonas sp. OAct 916]